MIGTELYNGPLNTKGDGKISGNVDHGSIGNAEVPAAIAQLEKSIKIRQDDNRDPPRGNPNGDPTEKQNYKRYQWHKEKIASEMADLEKLRRREEALR